MINPLDLQRAKLKTVKDNEIKDRSGPDYTLALKGEVTKEKEQERKDYFFSTGLDKWYASLNDKTFKTEFLRLEPNEARAIINHWSQHFKDRTSDDRDPPDSSMIVPTELTPLCERIDLVIESLSSKDEGVFVKLSTRSPKDSHVAFMKAKNLYQLKLKTLSRPSPNNKLILLQEVLIESLNVKSGLEAVKLLISSTRVGEDLEYALTTENECLSDTCNLVVREWVQLPLWAEFRGFVWNHKLTSVGQYNHPVVFSDLKEKTPKILSDLEAFFQSIKAMIPLERYIIDFAWTPEKVFLVEINPFDGEIVFPASTGLWNWDTDRQQMMNGPLELRIREDELDEQSLKRTTDPMWRAVMFPVCT